MLCYRSAGLKSTQKRMEIGLRRVMAMNRKEADLTGQARRRAMVVGEGEMKGLGPVMMDSASGRGRRKKKLKD